jgi:hypothetical protein
MPAVVIEKQGNKGIEADARERITRALVNKGVTLG